MRHASGFLFSLLTVLLFAGSSLAGTVDTLTFENVGPGNQIGGVYTYPYYFSINGSSTLTPLICDTYFNEISFGQSWQANVTNLASGQNYFMPIKDYEAAAILFSEILNGSVTPQDGNVAIWALFAGTGNGIGGFTPADQTLINKALGNTANQSLAFYSQFNVFTPTSGGAGKGGPQEFIGYTPNGSGINPIFSAPEPAGLPLLASGLVVLAGVLRNRFRAAA